MCSVPFANLEFYNTPDGDIMLKEVGKPARPFREADRDIISELLAIIRDRYPKAHAALMELYSKSTMNRHRENIKAKTRTGSVAEMITYWHENGLK